MKRFQRAFKLPYRYIFYGLSILYLLGDFYWFGGPLKSQIDGMWKGNEVEPMELAIKEKIVATVNAHPSGHVIWSELRKNIAVKMEYY